MRRWAANLRARPWLALAVGGALAVALLVWPSAAAACPQCALGRDEGPARDWLVVGMMATPFLAAVAAVWAIARALRIERARGDEGEAEDGAGEELER